MLGNRPNLLVPNGLPVDGSPVVLHSEAYAALMEAARENVPTETVGLLLGEVDTGEAGHRWLVVRGVEPVGLASDRSGLAPSSEEWENLKARTAASNDPQKEIIGWFYADPSIGIFGPRVDIGQIQRTLAVGLDLFLLVNPSTDQGAFYLWQDDQPVPLGGFYEALPEEGCEPVIPWNGTVSGGASRWFGTAGLAQGAAEPELTGQATEWPVNLNDAPPTLGASESTEVLPWYSQVSSALTSRAVDFSEGENRRKGWTAIGALAGILLIATLMVVWFVQADAGSAVPSNLDNAVPSATVNARTIASSSSPSASIRTTSTIQVGIPSSIPATGTIQPVLVGTATPSIPVSPSSTPVPALPTLTITPTPNSTSTPLIVAPRRSATPVAQASPTPIRITTTPRPTNTAVSLPTSTVIPTDTPAPVPPTTQPTDTPAPVPPTTQPTDTPAPVPTDTQLPNPLSTARATFTEPSPTPINIILPLPTLTLPLPTVTLPLPFP